MMADFVEKQANGLEVYELIDENGNFGGYFEPYSETNPEPDAPRYTSSINWTVSPGKYQCGVNQYTLGEGSKIELNISQSATGDSYLTFLNITTNSTLRFNKTLTTNGWKGTLALSGITTAVYSFGIENVSSISITYSGSYSL